MSNVTIPNLPSVASLSGSSQLQVVQNGTSYRATAQQIANLNANGGTVTAVTAAYPLSGGTISTSGSIGLTPASVDNTYLALMPAKTIKGNNTASTAVPVDLTATQARTLIGAAPINSPAFTGIPTAPTASTSDNSTQIATTAYVKAQGYAQGSVTSITAGTGLSGGTITLSGTIAIANTGITAATYGSASVVPVVTLNAQGQVTSVSNTAISIPTGQVSGLGTIASQNANAVNISGGDINGTTIGGTTPSPATFTTLTATGNTSLVNVVAGNWQGTPVAVLYGGTGASTASGARTNLLAAQSGTNNDITSLNGLTTPLSESQGGTGYGSYTTGDILYAASSSTLARLNDVATGNALISGGVGVAPSWGKIGLTTHVSGTLPVANGGTGATTLTGFLKGNGTSAVTAQATIGNADLTNSSITIGSTAISLGASTLTLGGLTTVTVTQDPVSALQLSTKQYVDDQVATVSNQTFHTQSSYATTADLGTVTYNNGTSGVGATITNAGTQAALTIDGYTFTVTDVTNATRVLVKDQSSGLQNGIYVVTNQGSGSTNWVLTRATDFNSVGTGPNKIETGAATFITSGTANGSTSWVMTTTGTITVGSTALVWAQTSSSGNILVTSPLSKAGNTISLGTVGVANGGTGLTSYTAYGLLYAPTTSSVGQIGTGTSGYPLLSGGSGAAPSFSQLSLTGSGITGTLGVTNGGTGTATQFTQGSIVFAGASGVYTQNNSKFFWDNTNIRLGINTATPQTQLTILSNTQTTTPTGTLPAGTDIYIVGANAANTRITQDAYGTGAYGVYTGRSARGTAASPTASQSGDILAQFTGRGYGATGFGTASTGRFDLAAAENFTDTAQGTYASVFVTALGANSPTESFRFGPAGQLGIGGATYGTSGYAFVSGGASAAPSWSQISLTAGVTGTLPVGNGGTGLTTYAIGDLLYASGTTTLSRLADVATGNVLLSGGVGVAPSWGQVSLTSAVTGTLPVANGGTGQTTASAAFNALSPITSQGDLILGTGTNTAGRLAIGANGYVLTSNGTTASWAASTGGVTSFSAGTTGFTPNTATTGAITLAGTLNVANGGTGQTTATAAFNALSPITSTGDLIIGNGTNSATRLAIGTNGYVLTSNGTTASWQASSGGVTSLTAGTGISLSGSTGAVTVTNSGVTSAVAGTGVSVSGSTGAVTFSIGQSVATSATVTFGSVTASTGTTTTAGAFTSSSAGSTSTVSITDTGTNGVYLKMVGNGATTPNKYLRVNSGIFYITNSAASSNIITVDDSGNLTAAANVTAYSDARLKKDVSTIDNALDLVGKMRGVRYTRTDTETKGVGVIAQEMQEVLPEVVMEGENLSVAYGNIVGVLIEAIKELRAEIKELKAKQ